MTTPASEERIRREWYKMIYFRETGGEVAYALPTINVMTDYWLSIVASEKERAVSERESAYQEVFEWLLGEKGGFPDLSQKPHYSFRTELRKKLQLIKGDQSK